MTCIRRNNTDNMYAQKRKAQTEDSNPLKKKKGKVKNNKPSDESGQTKKKKATCDVTAKNQPVPKRNEKAEAPKKTDDPPKADAPKKTDAPKVQIKDPEEEKERQAYHHTCNIQLALCSHV